MTKVRHYIGHVFWNYELSHPLLAGIFADTNHPLRFYGVVTSKNTAVGILIRRKVQ